MKWTSELDIKLSELIKIGKRHDEIGKILNVTTSSVRNRCNRLNLRIIYCIQKECKQCGLIFTSNIKRRQKFCSNACSNAYTNAHRRGPSEDTKRKISATLKGRCRKIKFEHVDTWRKCKLCGCKSVSIKRKCICETCRYTYYSSYRPSCEFKFDVFEYKSEFDLDLLHRFGWYSPTNRGNNLNGVSRDHLYTVKDGFLNNVDCSIISHPANCRLIKHSENSSKHDRSSISLSELKDRIAEWETKYGTYKNLLTDEPRACVAEHEPV